MMIRQSALAIGVLLIATAAHADKYTMSANKAYSIEQGLLQLGGYDKVIHDGAQDRVVKVPYDLGPGMRILVARNLAALETFIQVTRQAGKSASADETDRKKVEAAMLKVFDAPQDIDLQPVDLDQLNLAQNPIPAPTLALIMPIAKPAK